MSISQINTYRVPCTNRTFQCRFLLPIQIILGIIGAVGATIGGLALANYFLPHWTAYLGFSFAAFAIGSLLLSLTLRKKERPLTEIVGEEDIETLNYLLSDPNFDPNSVSCYGQPIVQLSAQTGHLDTVKLLLDHGADPYLEKDGITLLHAASRSKNREVLAFVLDNFDFDLNVADDDGLTPLIHAAYYGRLENAKTLIGRGACPKYISEEGHVPATTPWSMAYHNHYKVLGDFLLAQAGKIGQLWLLGRMLAHQFYGMRIILKYQDKQINLAGFSCMSTFSYMLQSIRKWSPRSNNNWSAEDTNSVCEVIEKSILYMNYEMALNERVERAYNDLQSGGIIALPQGWMTRRLDMPRPLYFINMKIKAM